MYNIWNINGKKNLWKWYRDEIGTDAFDMLKIHYNFGFPKEWHICQS